MIRDDEKDVGILFLSILDSKSTIEECMIKSGLTADKISTIISIPKFNKYFEKETDRELHITCKIDWIVEEIGNLIKLSDSESKNTVLPSTINVPADSSTAMRRLFFEGVKNTKLTTQDGLEPVEVTLTTPTRIITKEPGDSKLDIE